MTITSKGYGGSGQSIDTTAWADMAPHLGAAPHIVSGMSCTVTSAVNRTVQISTGTASGWGIFDDVTASETLTLDSETATSKPRWDAIVLRRDWEAINATTGGKGVTSLVVVKGATTSTSPMIPGGLNADPGVLADQLLFLLPVLNTGVGSQVRSGLFSGGSSLYVPSPEAFDAMAAGDFSYGQLVTVYRNGQDDLLLRRGSDASPQWDNLLDPPWVDLNLLDGIAAYSEDRKPQCRLRGGMLELSGVAVQAQKGTNFQVDGGVNQDYDIGHIPNPDWIPKTTRSAWVSQYGQGTNIEVYAGFSGDLVQAHVYGAPTGRITLDNISLRIGRAS
jgi:hypothetical protein